MTVENAKKSNPLMFGEGVLGDVGILHKHSPAAHAGNGEGKFIKSLNIGVFVFVKSKLLI